MPDRRKIRNYKVENNASAGELGSALQSGSGDVRQHGLQSLINAIPRTTAGGFYSRPATVQTQIAFPYDQYDLRQFSLDLGGDRQFQAAIGFHKKDKELGVFLYNTPRGQPATPVIVANNKIALERFTHSGDASAINLVTLGNVIQIRHPDIPIHELVFENGEWSLVRQRIVRMRYFTDTAADVQNKYPGLVWNVPNDSGNVDYRRVVDEESLRVTRAISDTTKINFFDNDLNGLADFDINDEISYTYNAVTDGYAQPGNPSNFSPSLLDVLNEQSGFGNLTTQGTTINGTGSDLSYFWGDATIDTLDAVDTNIATGTPSQNNARNRSQSYGAFFKSVSAQPPQAAPWSTSFPPSFNTSTLASWVASNGGGFLTAAANPNGVVGFDPATEPPPLTAEQTAALADTRDNITPLENTFLPMALDRITELRIKLDYLSGERIVEAVDLTTERSSQVTPEANTSETVAGAAYFNHAQLSTAGSGWSDQARQYKTTWSMKRQMWLKPLQGRAQPAANTAAKKATRKLLSLTATPPTTLTWATRAHLPDG